MPLIESRRAAAPPSSGDKPSQTPRALEAEARAALNEAGYEPVRRLECVVRGGTAVLSGRVPSFYLKQVAQSVVARRLKGAAAIVNRVEVFSTEALKSDPRRSSAASP